MPATADTVGGMTTRTATIGLIVCILVSTGFILGTTTQLPDPLAGRFDAAGQPVAWMSRAGYGAVMTALTVTLPLMIAFGLGAVIRRYPQRINLPHRDYWLAAERQSTTVRIILRLLIGLGCLHTVFMAAMHGAILQAHATTPPTLSSTLLLGLVGTYVLAIGAGCILCLRRFRRPAA